MCQELGTKLADEDVLSLDLAAKSSLFGSYVPIPEVINDYLVISTKEVFIQLVHIEDVEFTYAKAIKSIVDLNIVAATDNLIWYTFAQKKIHSSVF